MVCDLDVGRLAEDQQNVRPFRNGREWRPAKIRAPLAVDPDAVSARLVGERFEMVGRRVAKLDQPRHGLQLRDGLDCTPPALLELANALPLDKIGCVFVVVVPYRHTSSPFRGGYMLCNS